MRHEAIRNLYPKAVTINGDSEVFDKDGKTIKIDELKVNQEENRLLKVNSHISSRLVEYPSIEDQLDLLYHKGYDGWKKVITSIKEKHPKSS